MRPHRYPRHCTESIRQRPRTGISGIMRIRPRESYPYMAHHLGSLSVALYGISLLCYARNLYSPHLCLGRLASGLLAGGILLQYFDLLERSRWTHSVPYNDLHGSMSLFAWL